jgi:rifampicin phosphotransferase
MLWEFFMTFIKTNKSNDITKQNIGGKAYSLYLLGQQNLHNINIPEWFCIAENTRSLLASNSDNQIQYEKELSSILEKYGSDKLWAVRSSASSEDSLKNSFAGQLDTFLFVPTDKVKETITKVWDSIFSEHFLEYSKEKNISVSESPAVLVQLMVNADSAGVGFGVNPVTQDKEYVISSVFGLGNLLVSGESDADTWIIKNDKIEYTDIANKPKKEVLNKTLYGTEIINVDNPDSPSLTEEQIFTIQKIINKVSLFYGHPQDIEWAIENNIVYLLQSRPITTINEGTEILWDNSNIAESYGGITTPLTFSFAKKAYENVYRQLCLILSIPKNKIDQNDIAFRNMLGLVKGRVYYNMNSWYKTLALLPGFSLNKTFMEQMMGVKEQISDDLFEEIQSNLNKNRLSDLYNVGKTSFGLINSLRKLDKTVNDFYIRLEEALAPRDLKAMSLSDLMNYYNQLELKLLKNWDAPMVNDLFAMVFYGLLRKLSKKWCNDENESMQNTLILTQGHIISAEPAKLMKNMAKQIYTLHLSTNNFNDWVDNVNKSSVKKDIDQYIEKFGDRCLDELKLESITLSDNSILLYQTLYEMVQNKTLMEKEDVIEDDKVAKQLEIELLSKLRFFKRHIFSWIIKMARKTVRERENLRFERTRLFGRVRKIFLAMGQKMVEENIISSERDIFYLEVNEIQSFIEGTSTLTNLKSLIDLRKNEFDTFKQEQSPSDRFTTYGPVYIKNKYMTRQSSIKISGDTQQGLGCCPGIVRGKVKIVRDPKNVTLEKGVILVAERTDPGWIMLFSSVNGILVEKGSLLSHAAIVSRELNLPAVVSVPGLLDWLQDDDIVEMNGTTGTITKINNKMESE